MVKNKRILRRDPNDRVHISSHPGHDHSFTQVKHTKLLYPMIFLLSLFGFNVTMKKGHCELAWRCFVVIFIVITSLNRIYLLFSSALDTSAATSTMTAQLFIIVLVLDTMFTFLWLFLSICRLRKCLKRIFLILNYVWNHSNSKSCKLPYKRFNIQYT